jgi:hypothetical protein
VNDDWFDFTNYRNHPTQKGYHVYYFKIKPQAEYFEILLRANGIPYERHDDVEETTLPRFLFAIPRHYEERVRPLNFDAIGKYREKFIPVPAVRWLIMAVGIGLLVLAISGYFASK